jgi:nucleotide-binding universal stress UspA family protein
MYKRILVPLDGSATATRGLHEAIALAHALGATLRLLHVVTDIPMVVDMAMAESPAAFRAELRSYGNTVLTAASQLAGERGVKVEMETRDALGPRPASVITDEAKSAHCDLIVMGTHGRRGVSRVLLGSDAALVLQRSSVPVLLVRDVEPEL